MDMRQGKSSSKVPPIFSRVLTEFQARCWAQGSQQALSGGFKGADVQESRQLASSKIHRPGRHSGNKSPHLKAVLPLSCIDKELES